MNGLLTITELETLSEYAELKAESKRLSERIDAAAESVKAVLDKHGVEEVTIPEGKFIITGTRKWTYSTEIQSREASLNADKKEEQQRGTATYEVNPYLKFYEPKATEAE